MHTSRRNLIVFTAASAIVTVAPRPVLAALTCGRFDRNGVQLCEAGIDSTIAPRAIQTSTQ